ncbi:apolipoprotein B-100-like [Ptychodera flava]|uniref:apolipoprotein B-100-like n=1 Tax=Ptychodera flava TaxID=63121 RepID=UPI00396AB0DC
MKLFVVLLAVTAAFAGPVRKPEDDEPSRFQEGQRYYYQYEAETLSGIVGASERRTGMRIICDVEVEVPERGQLYVSTPKCELLEQDPESWSPDWFRRAPTSGEFSREMAKYSLKVEVSRGKITGIKAHKDEPVTILNIKRGMASALQLPIDDELLSQQYQSTNDVYGNCTAENKILEIRSNNQIRKVQLNKDLTNCSRPNKTHSRESPLSLVRNISLVQQAMNSTQNCTYTMSSQGYVKEVVCRESHLLLALSYNSSGVQANVTQILTRVNKPEKLNIAKGRDDSDRRITNVTYEFEAEPVPANKTLNTTLQVLFELVNKTVNETTMEAPRLFTKLVASLRSLDNETLHNLLPLAWNCSQTGNCSNKREEELSRAYITDALPQCGTWPCMSVITTALINSTINGSRADVLLYALAFEPRPSLEVINETLRVASALRSRPAMLTLGTLINSYYNNNKTIDESRELPEPVRRSIELLRDIIGEDCAPFRNEIDVEKQIEVNRQVLLALKSLGNIGKPIQIFDESVWRRSAKIVPTLLRCAENPIIPRNISLAAIQAVRRMESTEELRSELMSVLRDGGRDVEMRLVAYLILMKNPSMINLRDIVFQLKNEQVLQVRSFMASHITSILNSEEPTLKGLKEQLKRVVAEEPLPEVEQDIKRLSRHVELSKEFTIPFTNQTVAGQLQSNLIYSPDGILPRSLVFNMTLNALGKSLNVFETGIDMQGLEPMLEGLFGPQGYFPDLNLISLFKNLTGNNPYDLLQKKENEIKKDYKKFDDKVKKSKVVEDSRFLANQIHEALEDLHDDVSHKQLPPAISGYLKLLGNELAFGDLEDLRRLIPNITVNDLPSLSTIMKKMAEGIDYNITRSFIFLEANHVIPTGMGLPLNISVNGSTVVALRVAAKFDMRKYLQQDVVAAGLIAPSAAVEFVGRFGVNLPLYGESGVQLNTTLYHSSELSGNVTLKGTELRFNINKTMKPVNLINISSEQYLVRGEQVERLPGIKENRTEWTNCTSSLLNTTALVGLDVCTSLAYSNASYDLFAPRFPLSGPMSFNVTVLPTDLNLTTYTLLMKYEKVKRPVKEEKPARKFFGLRRQKSVEIIDLLVVNFTAPGQNLTRNISSQLSLNRNRTEVVWNFTIPELKNISMAAGVQNFSVPEKNLTQFLASFNATYGSKNFSNWLRVRNETLNLTRMENGRQVIIPVNNYSYAWNISLNDLYFSVESDLVNKTGNWSSSFNVTYYWDDQTPILDQFRPEYSIKPENYSKFLVLFEHVNKTLLNETLLQSTLNFTFGRQNISLVLLRSNNTQNSTKALNVSWVNAGVLRTMNITYEYKNKSTPLIEKIERVWNMSLPEWHIALLSQAINTSMEYNSTLNFTIYSQNRTLKEEVERYEGKLRQKYIDTYGEEAYRVIPSWYNASMTFAVRNETVPSSKPYPEVITTSFNISVMNPWNKTDIQNLTIVGKLVNDSRVNNANISYWTNINITLPLVNANISLNASVLNNTEGLILSYNASGLRTNFTSKINYTHSSYNVSMVFNLTSPLYNMSMNHTVYNSSESGLVYIFNSTGSTNYTLPIQNFTLPLVDRIREMIPENVTKPLQRLNITIPSIIGNISLPAFNLTIPLNKTLQLLNHTVQSNITIKPKNITLSLNASHPLFTLNATQEIVKGGPLANMTVYNVLNATVGEYLRMVNSTLNRTLEVARSMNLTNLNVTMVKEELNIYKDRLEKYMYKSPLNITFLNDKILKPIRKMELPELKALREPLAEMARELPKMIDELTPQELKDLLKKYTPEYLKKLKIPDLKSLSLKTGNF